MTGLEQLKKQLKPGKVYRRSELAVASNAVDRHLEQLVDEQLLQKLAPGMYYYPKQTVFGAAPPDDSVLVKSFLKDDKFLLTSPNAYNRLGMGTTQLYNSLVVYNNKRHGKFTLGTRAFDFKRKPFPRTVTSEFLLVDLVNNLDDLAEDKEMVLNNLPAKVKEMDKKKLQAAIAGYGSIRTKKTFLALI